MVFGTNYCAISHLPIKDGDECMLFPLGFRMDFNFSSGNKADINCFAYLYAFVAEPIRVVFEGNAAMIKYATSGKYHTQGTEYNEYELFMLVHLNFYQQLIEDFENQMLKKVKHLQLFDAVHSIWNTAQKFEKLEVQKLTFKLDTKELTNEEYIQLAMTIPTPEWIENIYKVALFMSHMGIPLHPNWAHDQHEFGVMYEKIRKKCLTNKIKKS